VNFWDDFWLIVEIFFFIVYLMILFRVIADLFRDRELSGWWKAVWVIFLIAIPFLTVLVYLIARGNGMAGRQRVAVQEVQASADAYIRKASGNSPADQITSAKALLDSGAIDQAEFDKLKTAALS
jgi:hypothetical protein